MLRKIRQVYINLLREKPKKLSDKQYHVSGCQLKIGQQQYMMVIVAEVVFIL